MDKQGPRSSAKDKAEFDTLQNMKTEATKAAIRTGLLRIKPEKTPSRRRQNCIWDEYNEIKYQRHFLPLLSVQQYPTRPLTLIKFGEEITLLKGYTFLQMSLLMLN